MNQSANNLIKPNTTNNGSGTFYNDDSYPMSNTNSDDSDSADDNGDQECSGEALLRRKIIELGRGEFRSERVRGMTVQAAPGDRVKARSPARSRVQSFATNAFARPSPITGPASSTNLCSTSRSVSGNSGSPLRFGW